VSDLLGSVSPGAEGVPTEHAHHWLIGLQNGPSSEGVCKSCGEQREFMNSLVRRQSSWIYRTSAPPGRSSGAAAEQSS